MAGPVIEGATPNPTLPKSNLVIDDPCGPACKVFTRFVELGEKFTTELSTLLQPGLRDIFLSAVGLWILWQAILFFSSKKSPAQLLIDFAPIAVASILMGTHGTQLIITIYNLALATMSGAAGLAFSVGGEKVVTSGEYSELNNLAMLAEDGLARAFETAEVVWGKGKATNPLPWFLALVIMVFYFIIIVAFVSQLIVAVFRLIMLSILASFLIMAFSFNWGRSMAFSGLRTLLSTNVVVFATTSALAIALYGASSIDPDLIDRATLSDPQILTAIAMGIIGSALMTEGVSIANSVTQSSLTNTAAGIMTAGAMATAAGAKGIGMAGINHRAAIGGAIGNVAGGAWSGAGIVGSALSSPGGASSAVASAAAEKLDKFRAFYDVGKNAASANFNRFAPA